MSNALTPPRGPRARLLVGLGRRLAVFAGFLALWAGLVALARPEPYLLPGPDRVARALVARAPEILAATGVTTLEILLGLACGLVVGLATAIAMALVPWTARLVQPAIVVIQTLPVFAIAPVLVLWFGFGLASKIVMATLVIFFPVAASLYDGLTRKIGRAHV